MSDKFVTTPFAVLPGQGWRRWWYDADEKKSKSWPVVGFAIYREEAAPHECDFDDDCTEGLSFSGMYPITCDGESISELREADGNNHLGILPEGESFTDEEGAAIYAGHISAEDTAAKDLRQRWETIKALILRERPDADPKVLHEFVRYNVHRERMPKNQLLDRFDSWCSPAQRAAREKAAARWAATEAEVYV